MSTIEPVPDHHTHVHVAHPDRHAKILTEAQALVVVQEAVQEQINALLGASRDTEGYVSVKPEGLAEWLSTLGNALAEQIRARWALETDLAEAEDEIAVLRTGKDYR
jgi:hypothetical protein